MLPSGCRETFNDSDATNHEKMAAASVMVQECMLNADGFTAQVSSAAGENRSMAS